MTINFNCLTILKTHINQELIACTTDIIIIINEGPPFLLMEGN